MIVDDDEDFAKVTATALRDAGHEVDIELTVEAGLDSMGKRPPDLAIIDVIFPEDISAGFRLARTMRQDGSKLAGVPILLLTAVNQMFPLGFGPSDIDSKSLPVNGFLEKPIDLDVLVDRVSSLLAERDGADQEK